jgi:hypothetical protein
MEPLESLQINHEKQQPRPHFEFPPVIQQPTTEDEIALCNWENEGGAPGRKDADDK